MPGCLAKNWNCIKIQAKDWWINAQAFLYQNYIRHSAKTRGYFSAPKVVIWELEVWWWKNSINFNFLLLVIAIIVSDLEQYLKNLLFITWVGHATFQYSSSHNIHKHETLNIASKGNIFHLVKYFFVSSEIFSCTLGSRTGL